ncbi:MAG: DUF2520 domain-containing protein [Mediterranea sp.]|nr:DUF2520 domain-containing protein [Mediterranea sp.]
MEKDMEKLPIAFLGAGNLAVNLAQSLYRNGFEIVQVYSRTEESAKSLADKVKSEWVTDLKKVTSKASLYIVSLKDSAFTELLPQIVEGKDGALLVHTAGSIPIRIWEGKTDRYGVFYPMQTFSKQREVNFKEIPFFVEAVRKEDAELLKAIASVLSDSVFEADSLQRKSLHLAAVFACNFTNHIYVLAADLLKKYDLPFEVMLPLIDETARKIHELLPLEAQTGPAVRHDEPVIREHLEMLSDEPAMKEIYRVLTENIQRRSRKE